MRPSSRMPVPVMTASPLVGDDRTIKIMFLVAEGAGSRQPRAGGFPPALIR